MKTQNLKVIPTILFFAIFTSLFGNNTYAFVHKAIEKAAQDIGKTVEKAGQDVGKTVEKAGQDAGKTVEKAGQDVGKTVEKAGQDVGKTAEKAVQDSGVVLDKSGREFGNFWSDVEVLFRTGDCGGDICDTLYKAVNDTAAESERAVENIEGAGQAIGHFIEDQAHSVGDTLSDAEKRIRSGKVIDALWHLGTDPGRHTSDNAAQMAKDSALISSVAQIAASAYGGPAGAAAFATWLTYNQTCDQGKCDASLALRAGMIAGATNAAMSAAGKLPSETTAEFVKKVAVAGAIGGLAVAASGGDEDAIRKGFMLTAGAVLIRDGYKRVTTKEFDARGPTKEAYCMSTANPDLPCAPKAAYKLDSEGKVVFDEKSKLPIVENIEKLDVERARTGNWGNEGDKGWGSWNKETGPAMKYIAKVPVVHPMSIFHDQWMFNINVDALPMGQALNVATIIPAAVLTYIGTGAPAYDLIQQTNMGAAKLAEANPYEEIVEVLNNQQQNTVSFNSDRVAISTLCIHGEKSRRIILDAPSLETGFACRVIYQNERRTSIPWYANNDGNYCKPKSVALTVKLIGLGWACYLQ